MVDELGSNFKFERQNKTVKALTVTWNMKHIESIDVLFQGRNNFQVKSKPKTKTKSNNKVHSVNPFNQLDMDLNKENEEKSADIFK